VCVGPETSGCGDGLSRGVVDDDILNLLLAHRKPKPFLDAFDIP
jgi:hypothetical protein